jgi:hypothetical protein
MLNNFHRQVGKVKREGPDLMTEVVVNFGREVLKTVTVMCSIFLNVTRCSPVVWEEHAVSIFKADL